MSSTKFSNQLTIGQAYENLTTQLLNFTNYITSQDKGNFKKWDIHDLDTNKKYEVKADLQVDVYNNLFIEYHHGKEPSGYSVTEADFYIYFARKQSTLIIDGKEIFNDEHKPDYNRYYLIPINDLRRIIDGNMFKSVRGGDGKKSLGYKVPERYLSDYLHVKM